MREVFSHPLSEGQLPDCKSDGDISDTAMCRSLWDQAALRLDKKQQAIVSQIRGNSCNPNELLVEVNKQVEKCKAKQWSIYTTQSGRRIFARDVLDRVTGFLQKITSVGDTLVQYDPGHLSIPWAFARFLLVAAVSDVKSYGAFLESMEKVTDTISRYVIIESLYLPLGLDGTVKLEDAIISLYTAILKYLCKAKLYFRHNTTVRVGISVLKVEQDASDLMAEISNEEASVEKWIAVNGAEQTFLTSVAVNDLNETMVEFRAASNERTIKLQNALQELQQPVCRMATQIDYIYSSIEGSEKTRIFRWISSLGKDYVKNHSTKSRYRLTESGQWLLKHQKYRSWLNSSSCSVLWLHGGAGYGKSFLVSLIIDRMLDQREENPNAAYLAYFYCTRDTAEPKRAQPVEILRSIVRQISCPSSQPIRKPVMEKWYEHLANESDHGLEIDECVSVLLELTRYNPAIICIDALDECNIDTRRDLLDAIDTIISRSEQIVKVFVSSRREDDFLDYFTRWEAIEISAQDNRDDIINFVDQELKNLNKITANKALLHGHASEQLVKDIKEVLLDRAEGMFRWVSACLEALCDPRIVLEEEVREVLGTLPKQLEDVYDIICSQIERRLPVGRKRAENVLRWLLYANKPLSCNEMIKAITMDNTKSPPSKENILSLCCNFVKVDEEIGVFQFVHLSVREYLEKRPQYEIALSHATIAESCLQACLTNLKPKRRANLQISQNKTFYDYAQVFWPFHSQMARQYRRRPPLESSFRALLCTGRMPSRPFSDWLGRWNDSWAQMELETRRGAELGMFEKLSECVDVYRHGNPIFAGAVFGFTEVIDDRREAGMGRKDSTWRNIRGRDPYEVAIRYGQEKVINILRSTTTLDSPAARESALLSAISLAEMSMVTMLLEDHLDLEVTEEIIAAAVATCDVSMLKFLTDRYPEFIPTERLFLIAASNESNGQEILKFLFEEGGNDIDDIDKAALLEEACSNGPSSLEIVQYITCTVDGLYVTEGIMKAAARNQFDGYQILRALLRIDTTVSITEDIVEATVRNTSAEPLRLLLSRFPASPVTWSILNTAARNPECAHLLLAMLLGHSSEALVDEDLLLAAVVNEKLAQKLLDVLLPRASPAVVTNDVLKAAAENRFLGHLSVEVLLKHVPDLRLESSIIEAGCRNLYYAPEVVRILLEHDSSAIITTLALAEAAANHECGVETVEFLLHHQRLILESIAEASDSEIHRDSSVIGFSISTKVVEAAASNSESGVDVMKLLFKWDDKLVVSPKAIENAAGNVEIGEELIALLLAKEKMPIVTSRAIERAAGNHSSGQVLAALLRCNRQVVISNVALGVAAMNPYDGLKMTRMLYPRWKGQDGFEDIISRAARNAQIALPIIGYLLNQNKGFMTSEIIESCASSTFADKEMISLLLKAAPGISLGVETVEAASNRPQHFFDILAVLREHDPDVRITNAAMYSVIRLSFNVVETIKELKKYHDELTITEPLLKSVVQNISANEATIVSLSEFQKAQLSTNGVLPVTEEIMAAALRNPGNGAVSMVRILLNQLSVGNVSPEIDERMLEIAINTYRAEAMVPVLIRYAQQNQRTIRVTRKALKNAAENKALKILLKLLPEKDKDFVMTPEVLEAAAKDKSQLEILINYATARGISLPINQDIFEHAVKGSIESIKTVLRFWSSTGQCTLAQSCVTEKALETSASFLRFFQRSDGLGVTENSTFHWLYRLKTDQGIRIPFTTKLFEKGFNSISMVRVPRRLNAVEYFQRILRRHGGPISISDLVTTEALKLASASRSEETLSLLLDTLSEQKRKDLLSRELLLAAAGSGADDCLGFLLDQKDFRQYSQYYEDISSFYKAALSLWTGKQRALLRRGTYMNAPSIDHGRTMLSFAAGYNRLPSVRLFMKFPGFALDAVDYDGRTALHFACMRGAETVIELLLARGANKTIKDNLGLLAEDYAIRNSHFMVSRMIRNYGVAKAPVLEAVLR